MIGRIIKGEIIRARFLNDMAEGVDTLTEQFAAAPKQLLAAAPGDVQNVANDITDPSIFIETTRSNSTVQVFDQNDENYAEIDRIDQVSFANGNGEVIILKFNN